MSTSTQAIEQSTTMTMPEAHQYIVTLDDLDQPSRVQFENEKKILQTKSSSMEKKNKEAMEKVYSYFLFFFY